MVLRGEKVFADEQRHIGRRFFAGWPYRQEDAHSVAQRIHTMARGLAKVHTAYGELWPFLAIRKLRPSDPGPVLDMPADALADLIDRRCRFDPPKLPAPVGPSGYSIVLANNRPGPRGSDPLYCGGSFKVGIYGTGPFNEIDLEFHDASPLWRNIDEGIEIVDALRDAWGAEWVSASAHIPAWEEGKRDRPWLAWLAKPLSPFPTPPYWYAVPHPFPFDHAGPPAIVRAEFGGELKIWP
jgi:hypothetical protein